MSIMEKAEGEERNKNIQRNHGLKHPKFTEQQEPPHAISTSGIYLKIHK